MVLGNMSDKEDMWPSWCEVLNLNPLSLEDGND
jgi:hypothetical protein